MKSLNPRTGAGTPALNRICGRAVKSVVVYAGIDTKCHPKITRYKQGIGCDCESPRRKLSHSPSSPPPENLDPKTSHRGFDSISESSGQRAKAGLFFHSPLASCVDFSATLTAVSPCWRSELSGNLLQMLHARRDKAPGRLPRLA